MCDLDKDKQNIVNVRMDECDIMELLRQYVSLAQRSFTESELLNVGVFNAYPDVVRRFLEGGGE